LIYDAIIVGARCAGASLAMLLARQGAKVLLVDRATFPPTFRTVTSSTGTARRGCVPGACSTKWPAAQLRSAGW
jgi:2-polyprenyl-6-methoxyphenol hydroxylase-like FAD-dependent oxidoreductase